MSFGVTSDTGNPQVEEQKSAVESSTNYEEMKIAVNWLEYEPNFLYTEFAH